MPVYLCWAIKRSGGWEYYYVEDVQNLESGIHPSSCLQLLGRGYQRPVEDLQKIFTDLIIEYFYKTEPMSEEQDKEFIANPPKFKIFIHIDCPEQEHQHVHINHCWPGACICESINGDKHQSEEKGEPMSKDQSLKIEFPEERDKRVLYLQQCLLHCGLTTKVLASMLKIHHREAVKWFNNNRTVPKEYIPKIKRILKLAWPRKGRGFIPLPSERKGPVSPLKLAQLLTEFLRPGHYKTKEIVAASEGELNEAFYSISPKMSHYVIGSHIAKAASQSNGQLKDLGANSSPRRWVINPAKITTKPPDESPLIEIQKVAAFMRVRDQSQYERFRRIEELLTKLAANQQKMMEEWGITSERAS